MTQSMPSSGGDAERAEILELLERRATVQQWLARLDQQRGSVSDRIIERVRQDYESRLQEALAALSTHRLAFQNELERSLGALTAAEEEHQARLDELEEARLRHLIGEVDEASWDVASAEMEASVERASAKEIAAREESERLRELLRQLDDRVADEPEPPFALEGGEETAISALPADVTAEETVVWTREESTTGAARVTTPFLEEIDRALTEPGAASSRIPPSEPSEEDTAPKPGIKCQECGYTNDLSAWFCGVCGADVG